MRRQLMIPEVEQYPIDLLPHTSCHGPCKRSLINGLFTPFELKQPYPHCRKCVGEFNAKHKVNAALAGK